MNSRRLFSKPTQLILKQPLLSMVVCICIANWQLLFGLRYIKWDSENYWHPWRYFISECYNNGIVPLWNPYTQSGYPVHGDLQGPAYSIDAILTSFLFKGSVYSINIIYLGYLIFGAYGIYKLSLFIIQNSVSKKEGTPIAVSSAGPILAGIIYSLSGYVTSHGHNLYIVISIGLVPWLLYYFFKIVNGGKLTDAVKLAIILFFQVTAGNPSFLIILLYFFVLVFMTHLVIRIRNKEFKQIKYAIIYFSVSALAAIILCAPVILNVALIFKDTTRATGLDISWAGLENSPLPGMFSFIAPFSACENFVDLSVRQPLMNYYIGLLTVPLAVFGLFKFKSFWLKCFGLFALFGFFVSLGLDTPLFAWLHKYLPFFNVFRMPKLIFIYDIIYLLILFSCTCCYVTEKQNLPRNFFRFCTPVLLLISIASIIYFVYIYPKEAPYTFDKSSVIDIFRTSNEIQKVISSLIISAGIFLVFYTISTRKKFIPLFFVLLLTDVVAHYNITAIVKVFSETKLCFKENYINNLPREFPIPDNNSPKNAQHASKVLQAFWMNSNIYIKLPEFSNNNSFALSNYALLEEKHKTEFDYVTNKPYAFLIDSIATEITGDISKTNKQVGIVSAEDAQKLKQPFFQRSTSDAISCSVFTPQKFVYKVENKKSIGFLLQQNYNSLWEIRINGGLIKPTMAYYTFPLLSLPPGTNIIEFNYEVPYFYLFFCISLIFFLILISYLIMKQSPYKKISLAFTFVLVCYCSICFAIGKSGLEQNEGIILTKEYNNTYIVLNTGQTLPKFKTNFDAQVNLMSPEDVSLFISSLSSVKNEHLAVSSFKSYFPPELNTVIENVYGKRITTKKNKSCFTHIYKKGESSTKLVFEDKLVSDSLLYKGIELKKGNEWGPTLIFKVADKKLKAYDLVLIEADIEADHTDFTGLCLSIDNKGTNKGFVVNLPLKSSLNKKRRLCTICTLPENTKISDEMKVFVWNPNDKAIFLHSMKIRVFRK